MKKLTIILILSILGILGFLISLVASSSTIKLNTANDTADISIDDRETGDRNSRLHMKWDLTSIPASSTIDDALLCLWIIDIEFDLDEDASISRFRNQSWTEADAPLNPTFLNTTTDKTWSSVYGSTWSCINVTLQVQESYKEGEKNLSLKLEDPDYMLITGEARDDDALYFGSVSTGFYLFFEDRENSGASGNTPYLNITYTETGGDTCSYVSGNWNIDCSDNCTINTNYNLNRNNITFTGEGSFYVNSNIINFDYTVLSNNCEIFLGTGKEFG